ncbi:DUF3168 domain-containing protein [Rhodovulum sp. DZ06]|uniref:DUF3168 domain-containing protein n=1 Tax=Rhodovulum sp. DZ06 TaxID=3425126 RepID=UPI003D3466D7
MSVLKSAALQEAIYAALSGDAVLSGLVEGRIFDEAVHLDAPGADPGPYVTLGDETVRDWSAIGLTGGIHEAQVSVHAPTGGFASVKGIAAEVERVLSAPLAPASGRVVTQVLRGARARRVAEGGRRIDLRFEFRVEA